MTLLTKAQELKDFCDAQRGVDFIAVDTEFMRERTYYSRLCLIQLATERGAVAVDPLAEGMDLAPLYALFDDPTIIKVFHAARQDVEIFFHATGRVPTPLFDTQVAAMVCGFGEAASYETLAGKLAGARVDKSSRFTDWARRPLTEKQIDYALGDVTHLRVVYRKLCDHLNRTGRADWVSEEMAFLASPDTYRVNPDEVWRRLKLRIEKPRLAALVRELAAWREREAQRLDIPRQRVMKDETLMEIAHHAPQDAAALGHTRGLSNGFPESRAGGEVLAAVARVLAMTPDRYPVMERKRGPAPGASLDLLRVLLRQVSEEQGVAARLIACGDDLDALAASENADIPALKGWRRQLFGETALAVRRGELALAVKGDKVVWFGV